MRGGSASRRQACLIDGCLHHLDHCLLYVGISPSAPPTNGKPPSRQSLRTRLRYHYRGNAEGSTLRITLGCLLGLTLRSVGSGRRMTFAQDEARLSEWMAADARVPWMVKERPWDVEHELIATVTLPLNLDQNRRCGFHSALSTLRRQARESAKALTAVK